MPKSTFYRLPQEKRERIISAAREEFFRVPFAEASINKIIKNAEIPRGSFYQYFDDKQDVFQCVLKEQYQKLLQSFRETIRRTRGDIFQFVYIYLDEIIDNHKNKMGCGLKRSLSSEESTHIISGMLQGDKIFKLVRQGIEENLICFVDFDLIKVSGDEEKRYFIDILAAIVKDGIQEFIQRGEDESPETIFYELKKRLMFFENNYRK